MPPSEESSMPRPTATTILSPGQATYVLEKLRKAGHVTATQIKGYLADMGREIRDLEDRLRRLRQAAGSTEIRTTGQEGVHGAPAAKRAVAGPRRKRGRPAGSTKKAAPTPAPDTTAKPRKRKFTVTAKVLASRELQGRYLALLNKMPKGKRGYYTKLAKEKGREAAIKEMKAERKK
jgi:hypothetical protein